MTLFDRLDPLLVAGANHSGYTNEYRADFLQTARLALWQMILSGAAEGQPGAELVRVSLWRARDELRRELRHAHDELPEAIEEQPLPRSRPASRRVERARMGRGADQSYTLQPADVEALSFEEFRATLANLRDRGVLSRADAEALAVELDRLPAALRRTARAVLCSCSAPELESAGHSRRQIAAARAAIVQIVRHEIALTI